MNKRGYAVCPECGRNIETLRGRLKAHIPEKGKCKALAEWCAGSRRPVAKLAAETFMPQIIYCLELSNEELTGLWALLALLASGDKLDKVELGVLDKVERIMQGK